MKFISLTVLAIVAMVFLAACGGGGRERSSGASSDAAESSSGPESVTLDVVLNDIYYGDSPTNADSPPTWTVPAGSEMTINLKNNGALEHNFAIIKKGSEIPIPFVEAEHGDIILEATGLNKAGETTVATLPAPEPGEYQVTCTVAGHYPSMQGRLVVTE